MSWSALLKIGTAVMGKSKAAIAMTGKVMGNVAGKAPAATRGTSRTGAGGNARHGTIRCTAGNSGAAQGRFYPGRTHAGGTMAAGIGTAECHQ